MKYIKISILLLVLSLVGCWVYESMTGCIGPGPHEKTTGNTEQDVHDEILRSTSPDNHAIESQLTKDEFNQEIKNIVDKQGLQSLITKVKKLSKGSLKLEMEEKLNKIKKDSTFIHSVKGNRKKYNIK